MKKLEFNDKRDSNGLLLFNSGLKLSHIFADNSMKVIVKYDLYKNLTYHYDKEYIEFYFKKLLFTAYLPIANQIVINNWNNKNNNCSGVSDIDISSFPSVDLLNLVAPVSSNQRYKRSLKVKLLLKLSQIKNSIKSVKLPIDLVIENLLSFSLNYKNIPLKNKYGRKISTVVGPNTQGTDLNKRSAIFWLQDININPQDVLVYFNSKRKKSLEVVKDIEAHNINWVNLRYWKNKHKPTSIYEILKPSKSKRSKDPIYKWLFLEAGSLIVKVHYWHSFFSDFNVAIHNDHTERGQEVIIKQIALCKLNSLSFSYQRSYLDFIVGRFYSYYPTDIFFSWGQDSTKRITKKVINQETPPFKSIVTSGCVMLDQFVVNQYKDIEYIKKKFDSYGVKKTILFLDTNHSLCDDYQNQVVLTSDMKALYESLLSLLIHNPDTGLIIKTKKLSFYKTLNINKIIKVALDTNRLHIISDGLGIKPSVYATISDMILGVSAHDIPASLLECVLLKKPGIIYNYGGLKSVEPEFFSWAYNTVIFDSIDDIISSLNRFILSEDLSLIGNWSGHLQEFDSFLDFKAVNRIGLYLSLLFKYSDKGFEKDITIGLANDEYSRKFGKDKVTF